MLRTRSSIIVCRLHNTILKILASSKLYLNLHNCENATKFRVLNGILYCRFLVLYFMVIWQIHLSLASYYMFTFYFTGDVMDILALLNSAINFILYCSMSRQFRKTFNLLFRPKFLDRWMPLSQNDMQYNRTDFGGNGTTHVTQITQV